MQRTASSRRNVAQGLKVFPAESDFSTGHSSEAMFNVMLIGYSHIFIALAEGIKI
jgi:hypothetical protein